MEKGRERNNEQEDEHQEEEKNEFNNLNLHLFHRIIDHAAR